MKKSTFVILSAIFYGFIILIDELLIDPYVNQWQNSLIMMIITAPVFYFIAKRGNEISRRSNHTNSEK
ncbi:hypothetical protein [Fructobacillus durionis]|uniref:Uncharacterized protein n=1 Tax=Fructobacillus durionis TaxID=283737 RepID=A0A1I1E0W8_9LACO|nr:hypothetical protein [Fructobacillus durionis]SFB80306.1 hypothetical protein SAMN05660453_0217 [Fructobacillus durionis]